ncbi:BT_3987 domain-containing protein [Bacteroides sp.]|uniref:BT_3987 domain-containing protein n=1 Tax=Bacteroides sp. TaxID=29523 RepID=UPI0025C3AD3C|nr:DUF1735 domain-containing protein [Bacteroides sp.]
MKKINILYYALCLFLMTSCYDDYVKDYDVSTTYFASQNPLRTVIADRDMTMKVGVAIGGKREVNTDDWAEFEIDPTLLEGTGLTLLPQKYYTLSNPDKFQVSKTSLAVADVVISFTDDFYADYEKTTKVHYALPFRVTDSSLDKILEGKETSIVAVKYISTYHGTYYVKGTIKELSVSGEVVETKKYENKDLSKNITRAVNSLSKNILVREGVADFSVVSAENVKMTMQSNHTVTVETLDGSIEITDGSGTYDDTKERLEISLKYRFKKDAKQYEVEETLVRRQDPLKDLHYEEW